MNRKKILIIDDNPVILATLSAKLKAKGYDPSTATEGAEAISLVRQERPDLILLDLNFPPDVGIPWDGFRILEWLQHMDEGKTIPVIVITGGKESEYKERSLDAGAVAFFTKPIESDELLTVIRQAFEH